MGQTLPVAEPYYAGGAQPAERAHLEVHDPARPATVVGRCSVCTEGDVDAAVASALSAAPGWAGTPAAERARVMLEAAARLEEIADDLAETLIREVGKPRHDAVGDVRGALHLIRSFAALADDVEAVEDITGQVGTGRADLVLTHRVPIGPAVVITPWNTPIYLSFNAIAPALVAGCPVLVKPSEVAPLALTRALHAIGPIFPSGVVNVLPGPGDTTGAALTRHPGVRAISFTGGTVSGRAVLESAAATVKKVSLELGGNDPAVILEDADLSEATMREIVAGAFSLSGQVCFNIKRIYVHRSRMTEFTRLLCGMVDQLAVGPGDREGVHLGPLTIEKGFTSAKKRLERARQLGQTVHQGGRFVGDERVGSPDDGWFVMPAVVTDLPADDPLVLEEQFAPIIPVVPFDTDDEAVTEANRTEFGLCSSVWSRDRNHARAVAMRIEAGNTFINAHRVGASVPAVPFGGVKQSGLGRNHLQYAVAEFTEEHAVIGYRDAGEDIPGIAPWTNLLAAALEGETTT